MSETLSHMRVPGRIARAEDHVWRVGVRAPGLVAQVRANLGDAVRKGQVLASYHAERAPVAKQIVERANRSIVDTGRIMQALDLTDTSDVGKLEERLAARKAPGSEGDKTRRALREAIAFKSYEFNAHGVEHNHRYVSDAVVPENGPQPEFVRDPELYAQPASWPGAKVPHAWVTRAGVKVSTLDLGGGGEFSVYTGIGGRAWLDAAAAISAETGLTLAGVSIGPGEEYEDPYGTWAEVNEIDDAGVLLVRPDLYVAYRYGAAPSSPAQARELLGTALRTVLGTPDWEETPSVSRVSRR